MGFKDLQDLVNFINESSEYKYVVSKVAKQSNSEKYNDRPIKIYFENDGRYVNERRLIHLITIHDHKYGAIDTLSNYMGYEHETIFKLAVTYVQQRRSERAPMNHQY